MSFLRSIWSLDKCYKNMFHYLCSLKMKIFNFKPKVLSEKGFTLIELLIVIGILGILASALVATIDPFEQLKKATDANVKNVSVEYLNANMRYYMTHNAMPWTDTANTNQTACASSVGFTSDYPNGATLVNMISGAGCLKALVDDGELKTGFTNATSVLSSILVTESSANPNSLTVCFQPQSKSQRSAPDTKWDKYGATTPAGCPNATLTSCYWCTQ